MGMYGSLRRISAAQLADLRTNPELAARLTDPDDEEFGGAEWSPDGPELDLDKSWQVLHFLVTGDAWKGDPPLSNAILGGTEVGPDMGYGPARVLSPDEVRVVAAALLRVSEAQLRARFNPDALQASEVYPGMWKPVAPEPKRGFFRRVTARPAQPDPSTMQRELAEFLDFAMVRFRGLVGLYQAAAKDGDAMLLWLA